MGSRNRGFAQLGNYVFVAKLGRGAMAEIFLTVTRSIGSSKLVVLKAILPELADDPEFVDMFLDEARLAARLNHPNVVQTVEVGQVEGSYFLTMEYLDGRSLLEICRRAELAAVDLPLSFHLAVICQTLAALQYAHELADYDGTPLHIVHRDVTPANIFLTFEGVIKLVDFGIAKAARRQTKTRLGVVKGKQAYLAPEQMLQEDTDRRADIYSLGVVLWQLLAERPLWPDDASSGALRLMKAAPRLRTVRPDLDEGLDAICARALATRPDDRFASAAEMLEAVESFLRRRGEEPLGGRELAQTMRELFGEDREAFDKVVRLKVNGVLEEDPTLVRPAGFLAQDAYPTDLGDDAGQGMARWGTAQPPASAPAHGEQGLVDLGQLHAGMHRAAADRGRMRGGSPASVPDHRGATAGFTGDGHGYATTDTLTGDDREVRRPVARSSPAPRRPEPASRPPTARPPRTKAASAEEPSDRQTSAPLMAVAGGLVGAAALAIVMLLASRWPAAAPAPPSPPAAPERTVALATPTVAPVLPDVEPPPSPKTTPPPVPRTEYVELTLRATPPQARFFLDGARLEGNPFIGRFPRDDAYHQLRVVAPGHVSRYEALRFDRDLERQIGLPRAAPPPPREPFPPAPSRDAGPGPEMPLGHMPL